MGSQSTMPPRRGGTRFAAILLGGLLGGLAAGSSAVAAQEAAYFSPTYAASKGSPYSDIYARTFGAPTLETAAAPPAMAPAADAATAPEVVPDVVYVIEDGRLLSYRATDYARGTGEALVDAALAEDPAAPRLYGAIPPPAGGGPIPLLPQNQADPAR